ncbi:glycerate kinase [Microbacterium sp. YY-01]|uniref:glycerate kinase n=1 Tax=Microbacterium sp. YY-01 TaxID=3421634 RepID=UPI003D162E54
MSQAHPRLTVTFVPDSFKGSLTSPEVVAAMSAGFVDVFGDDVKLIELPLADGGEGTLDALLANWNGTVKTIEAVDAIGRPCIASYGISNDGKSAIIEAAQANGLPAVSDTELQPLRADSFGVGLLALDAIENGVEQILLCIGGSASSDGGTGLLRALGARFLDENDVEVRPGGGDLGRVADIDLSRLHPRARQVEWRLAVDVESPLVGETGAASIYGPQKGASTDDIQVLDKGLRNLIAQLGLTPSAIPVRADTPGMGAAGGLPLSAVALLGADMVLGSQLVSDAVDLTRMLADTDLIITGEGSFDEQSLNGKVVDLVRKTADSSIPIIVIAGSVELAASEIRSAGIAAAFSIAEGPTTLTSLVETAKVRVRETAANVAMVVQHFLH